MGMNLLARRRSPRYTLIILFFYVLAYLFTNRVIDFNMSVFAGNYLMPTLVWGLIIGVVSWLPAVAPRGKLRLKRLLRWLALMCVFIALFGMIIQGAMSTFGKSPYNRSMIGILINIITLGTAIMASEMSRAWLLNRHFARHPLLGISLISLVFGILSFPVSKITDLTFGKSLVEFMGQELCPALGESILASYLAWLGGPIPAFIYRAGLSALVHFSPILPNSDWVSQSLLGVLAPVFGLIMVHTIYGEEARIIRAASERGANQVSWTLTCLVAILIVWFNAGVFSYKPKVIMTGSMEPQIMPGDVVIVHKSEEVVKLGDIIMFPANRMLVTHRVVAIKEEEGKRSLTTKGDANPSPDPEPVLEADVQGKVILVVPQIGKGTQLLRGGSDQAWHF